MNVLNTVKIVATAALLSVTAAPAFASANTDNIANFYQTFNTGDASLLDKVLAPEWEDIPMNPGQGPGRDGFKPLVPFWAATFGDLKIEPQQVFEDGDYVIVRSRLTGKHVGDFAGVKAKGNPIDIMTIDIHQFKDGKVIKTWHLEDWMSGLGQMGAFDK